MTNDNGPDLSHCGKPLIWSDQLPPEEDFVAAVGNAHGELGVEIELCRWSVDDPIAAEYAKWWERQRSALRRHIGTNYGGEVKATLARRTDKGDGFVKCYVRFNRIRPSAVREAA